MSNTDTFIKISKTKLEELLSIISDYPNIKSYKSIEVSMLESILSEGEEIDDWVSVKDKLPAEGQEVMVYVSNGRSADFFVAFYYKNDWKDSACCNCKR